MIYKCPVPGCYHVAEVITANHYETQHHMTREQVRKKYGNPKAVMMDRVKMKNNLSMHVKVNRSDLRM